jgi:hypothetical protein
MQQHNHSQSNIKIRFFIITEHLSFLPTTILNACQVLRVSRPENQKYIDMSNYITNDSNKPFLQYVADSKNKKPIINNTIHNVINSIDMESLTNTKEIRSFQLITSPNEIPKDVFNIICDNIIIEMLTPQKITFTALRDTLYDILTYNLDVTECLWYILRYFIENKYLSEENISDILIRTYSFLKYYNNNYRPIYHLESIIFYIINKIHNFNEL